MEAILKSVQTVSAWWRQLDPAIRLLIKSIIIGGILILVVPQESDATDCVGTVGSLANGICQTVAMLAFASWFLLEMDGITAAERAKAQCRIPEGSQCSIPEDRIPEDSQCRISGGSQCSIPEDSQCRISGGSQCSIPEGSQCRISEGSQCSR